MNVTVRSGSVNSTTGRKVESSLLFWAGSYGRVCLKCLPDDTDCKGRNKLYTSTVRKKPKKQIKWADQKQKSQ